MESEERLEDVLNLKSCPSVRLYSGFPVYRFRSNGTIRYLDLSSNNLSGSIPESLGSMYYLQVLNVGRNRVTGTIPDSLGSLKDVGFIDLSHNHLEGRLLGSGGIKI